MESYMGAHFANCVFSRNYMGLGPGSASAAGHGRARGGQVGRGGDAESSEEKCADFFY